jgi:hypothetical protein
VALASTTKALDDCQLPIAIAHFPQGTFITFRLRSERKEIGASSSTSSYLHAYGWDRFSTILGRVVGDGDLEQDSVPRDLFGIDQTIGLARDSTAINHARKMEIRKRPVFFAP